MFLKRFISGIILVILSLLLIIQGGDILLFSTLLLSLVGTFELNRALSIQSLAPSLEGYLMSIFYYMNLKYEWIDKPMVYSLIFLIILLTTYVVCYPNVHSKDIFTSFFGFFYVSVMLSFIYLTRMEEPNGKFLVWIIFLCAWGSDTFAYCVGRLFGKHKMTPILSPKKSIEGAIGGILGAAIINMIYVYFFINHFKVSSNFIWLIGVMAAIAAFVSMIGDLAASAIKRDNKVKDYGDLIPGHGGVLDRFDSIIITAPIIYFLTTLSIFIK